MKRTNEMLSCFPKPFRLDPRLKQLSLKTISGNTQLAVSHVR